MLELHYVFGVSLSDTDLNGEIILTNNDKDATEFSNSVVARIIILLITAAVSIGFIYSMLYKGSVYEALFGTGGYFSDMEDVTLGENDPESDLYSTFLPNGNSTEAPSVTPSKPAEATTPKITVEPTIKPMPTFTVLKDGMETSAVRELQTLLTKKGYYTGPITGYFGSMTENAVEYFQGKNKLPQTGIVDKKTWDTLVALDDVI